MRKLVRPLSTTPRDQLAVSGQILLSAAGQILLATDTRLLGTGRAERVRLRRSGRDRLEILPLRYPIRRGRPL
jgi:hypothetical protein